MEDHNHAACFRTSKLYLPCTLLELMSWADEIHTAAAARRVLAGGNPDIKELAAEWRAACPKHSFRVRASHLGTIMTYFVRPPETPDGPETYAITTEEAYTFLDDLLHALSFPFACWRRVLVDLEKRTLTPAGFAVDADCILNWWDPDWSGFEEITKRPCGPGAGIFVGCPHSGAKPTELLFNTMAQDPVFLSRYFDANADKLVAAVLPYVRERLPKDRKFTKEDVVTILGDATAMADMSPALDRIVDDMFAQYMARANKADRN